MINSPRMSPATRPSDEASEESLKKQRAEEPKRQKINQLKLEYEQGLSVARVAYKEYFTIDDVGAGEENICLSGIPMGLWSDALTHRPSTR